MKILPVRWSRQGELDLVNIADDIKIATSSIRLAVRYAARIEERCRRIGNAPHSGRPRDDLAPGLRTVAFERSALICYIIDEDIVWITNIFRRGRDYEAILRDHSHFDTDD
jgi:toxin ParE1/3/4